MMLLRKFVYILWYFKKQMTVSEVTDPILIFALEKPVLNVPNCPTLMIIGRSTSPWNIPNTWSPPLDFTKDSNLGDEAWIRAPHDH